MKPIAFLLALALVSGCESQQSGKLDTQPPDQKTGTVTFLIQESSDSEIQEVIVENVADGTTLDQVMSELDSVTIVGSGKNAFVDAIGGKKTGVSEGWIFRIDGELANQGIGATVLHPPTTIQWTYGGFEMMSEQ